MNTGYIENILYNASDIQHFADPRDVLSKLVTQFKPVEELDFDELEFVSAAGCPSYQNFVQRLKESCEHKF